MTRADMCTRLELYIRSMFDDWFGDSLKTFGDSQSTLFQLLLAVPRFAERHLDRNDLTIQRQRLCTPNARPSTRLPAARRCEPDAHDSEKGRARIVSDSGHGRGPGRPKRDVSLGSANARVFRKLVCPFRLVDSADRAGGEN
jgi:hypothetical protein